jgi:type 1 glutamine amidotransferase
MNRRLFVRFLVAFCCFTAADFGVETQFASDEIRVLIVTGIDHPAHNWRETTPALREELAKDTRFKVDVLEDPYQLDSADLARYQVVFLHFNNWQKPDPGPRAQANLKKFVTAGGGLVLLHFACGAFADWAEFPELVGMVWDRKNTHDPRGPFHVEVVNREHPITRGMESFDTDDELYICLEQKRQVELLAQARSKKTGRDHPMAFALTCGKGRVFHTSLGHDARAIHAPGTAELIRRGVAWVAGR